MNNTTYYINSDIAGYYEIVPVENEKTIGSMFKEFEEEDKQKGIKIYEPKSLSCEISERKIPFNDFMEMTDQVLKEYGDVRFEDFPEEAEDEYFAFGNSYINIFGGITKNGGKIIEWLNANKLPNRNGGDNNVEFGGTIDYLYRIGEKYRLVILDSKERKIINLRDKAAITAWLK